MVRVCILMFIVVSQFSTNTWCVPDVIEEGDVQTFVRIGIREGNDRGQNYGDYKGAMIMVETRPRDFRQYRYVPQEGEDEGYYWCARILFRPRGETSCNGCSQGNAAPEHFVVKPSQIYVDYITHKDYFRVKKTYGKRHDGGPAPLQSPEAEMLKFIFKKSVSVQEGSTRAGESFTSKHRSLLKNCFFEWEINPMSLMDLIVTINQLRGLSDSVDYGGIAEFPRYCYEGVHAYEAPVYNCVTFVPLFLKKLSSPIGGVILDADYEASYAYEPSVSMGSKIWSGFKWTLKTGFKVGVVIGVGAVGGALGAVAAEAVGAGEAVVELALLAGAAWSEIKGKKVVTAVFEHIHLPFLVRSLTNRYLREDLGASTPTVIFSKIKEHESDFSFALSRDNVAGEIDEIIRRSAKRVNYELYI